MSNAPAPHAGTPKPLTPPAGHKAADGAQSAAPATGKPPKAPKVPKEPKESNFKRVYPDTSTIQVLTPEGKNPKRVGSKAHETFELYSKNKTVGEFIKNGGFYAALSWDVGHGFIKVG